MPNVLIPPPFGGVDWAPYSQFNAEDPRIPIDAPPAETAINALADYIKDVVYPRFQQEELRLKKIGLWMEGKQPFCQRVSRHQLEKQALLELSRSPWLGLAVDTFAQVMYVDGYRSPGSKENASPWKTWNANNFQAHQIAVHRAAIGYGYSYVRVLPGQGYQGNDQAVMRGVSPKRLYAMYDDPLADEFPAFALEFMPDQRTWRWYGPNVFHEFLNPSQGGKFQYQGTTEHGVGVTPVVRYVNKMDLDGRCIGDVEPVISVAARIDKTDYDRLLVQHYNSWKVRWATGLEQADDDAGREADKRKLAQEDVMVSSDPNVKFGSLDETNMAPFIQAHESDVESLAAMEQLPSHLFSGKVINVSAEALAAARAQTMQKLLEKQTSMGVSHGRLLRLVAAIDGDAEAASDFDAKVSWTDVEVRSLAQAADAYGKIAQQLGVPKQFLWRFIPGFTAEDVEEMSQHTLDDDPLTKFLRETFPTIGAGLGQDNPNAYTQNATLANRSGSPRPARGNSAPPS